MAHNPAFLNKVNQAKAKIKECTVMDVQNKLNRGEEFYLIDTREDLEWQAGHLPKALHIGKGVLERDIETKVPNKNAEIILYCGGGFRSALAAEALLDMGYTHVISMDGGIREWTEKGFEIQKQIKI